MNLFYISISISLAQGWVSWRASKRRPESAFSSYFTSPDNHHTTDPWLNRFPNGSSLTCQWARPTVALTNSWAGQLRVARWQWAGLVTDHIKQNNKGKIFTIRPVKIIIILYSLILWLANDQPRDRTWVSRITGRLFTVWTTREDPQWQC